VVWVVTNTMATKIYAAYITESGVLKGTTKGNEVLTFMGPFERIKQKEAGPPFLVKNERGKFIELMDLEESSFLLPRTRNWFRGLPVDPLAQGL
jgi:hypothetical protein